MQSKQYELFAKIFSGSGIPESGLLLAMGMEIGYADERSHEAVVVP
jgi:hypothetical protein